MQTHASKRKPRGQNRAPSQPKPSVGSTVAADMGVGEDFIPSIRTSVSSTISYCKEMVPGASQDIVTIAESLLWPLIGRRSTRLEMYSPREFGRFRLSFLKTFRTLVKLESPDAREQMFVKYWVDYYLAQGFSDSVRPERADWIVDPLFSGWCRRTVARAVAQRDLSFLYSLQKGSKQMWPPLKEANLVAAVEKSIVRLTVKREPTPLLAMKMARKVGSRVFGSIKWRSTDLGSRFMPSESACLQASIKNGGALGLFAPMIPPSERDTSRLGYLRSVDYQISLWRQETFDESFDLSLRGGDEIYDVRWVGIFEPGKIRSVSLGNGHLYTALQPLQGKMLNCWKSQPQSTMDGSDLTDSINLMFSSLPEDWLWCSGDYEAATDLLHRDVSLAALESVPYHPLLTLAVNSFSKGRVGHPVYPKPTDRNAPSMVYRDLLEGQLMGHPLSFPLLCVINLAVLQLSLDLWVEALPLRSIEERISRGRLSRLIFDLAKINGDDILFRGPRELIDKFKEVSGWFGLKISQGKNYVSPHSCMINSQIFTLCGGVMVRKGYLNLRLVKGSNVKARKAAGESVVDPTHIGRDLDSMVSLCRWTACSLSVAFDRWKHLSEDFQWFRPNWFLPVHLGGYGVSPRYAPKSLRITRGQRLLAAHFVNNPDLVLYRAGGFKLRSIYKRKGVLRFRVVPGSYVPDKGEDVFFSGGKVTAPRDNWLERLSYAEQASREHKFVNEFWRLNRSGTNDFGVFLEVQRMRRDFRLKPMSAEGLILYRDLQLVAVRGPSCPPISHLSLKFPYLSTQYLIRQEFFLE